MFEYVISLLEDKLKELRDGQLSSAEDARDGVKETKETLVEVLQDEGKVLEIEDVIRILKDISEEF